MFTFRLLFWDVQCINKICCACLLHVVVSFRRFTDFFCSSISLQRNLCERVATCSPRVWTSFFYLSHSDVPHVATGMHPLRCLSVFTDRENHRFEVSRPVACGRQCNLYFLSPPGCIFKIDFPFASSLVPLVLLLPNAGTRLHGATSRYLVVSQLTAVALDTWLQAAFCRPWCAVDNTMSIKPHYHDYDEGPSFFNCKLNPLTETFIAKLNELPDILNYGFLFYVTA